MKKIDKGNAKKTHQAKGFSILQVKRSIQKYILSRAFQLRLKIYEGSWVVIYLTDRKELLNLKMQSWVADHMDNYKYFSKPYCTAERMSLTPFFHSLPHPVNYRDSARRN